MTKHDQKGEEKYQSIRNVGLVTMIPMALVSGLVVGYFFGNWIDNHFRTNPWGKIILSVLGVIAGIKQTVNLIQEATKEDEK